jgi:hypothetical protein
MRIRLPATAPTRFEQLACTLHPCAIDLQRPSFGVGGNPWPLPSQTTYRLCVQFPVQCQSTECCMIQTVTGGGCTRTEGITQFITVVSETVIECVELATTVSCTVNWVYPPPSWRCLGVRIRHTRYGSEGTALTSFVQRTQRTARNASLHKPHRPL